MGIDVYLEWDGRQRHRFEKNLGEMMKAPEEERATYFNEKYALDRYIRESYGGHAYATETLFPEAWQEGDGTSFGDTIVAGLSGKKIYKVSDIPAKNSAVTRVKVKETYEFDGEKHEEENEWLVYPPEILEARLERAKKVAHIRYEDNEEWAKEHEEGIEAFVKNYCALARAGKNPRIYVSY